MENRDGFLWKPVSFYLHRSTEFTLAELKDVLENSAKVKGLRIGPSSCKHCVTVQKVRILHWDVKAGILISIGVEHE